MAYGIRDRLRGDSGQFVRDLSRHFQVAWRVDSQVDLTAPRQQCSLQGLAERDGRRSRLQARQQFGNARGDRRIDVLCPSQSLTRPRQVPVQPLGRRVHLQARGKHLLLDAVVQFARQALALLQRRQFLFDAEVIGQLSSHGIHRPGMPAQFVASTLVHALPKVALRPGL